MSSPSISATRERTTSRPWLTAAVLVAPIGPLAIAVLRGILPYDTEDDAATIVAQLQASPAAASAVLWLLVLALLTLPLGLLITGRLAVRTRPVLGSVAAVVAWVGFMSLFAIVGLDHIAPAAATAGLPVEDVVALDAAMAAHPIAGVAVGVFVVGHILGAVLLGVALWGAIPRWAAVALIVSQPLHLLFAVFVVNHALDAAAWSLTAVGFAAAAVAATRLQPGTTTAQ